MKLGPKQIQHLIFICTAFHFNSTTLTLFDELKTIDKNLPNISDVSSTKVILYGENKFNDI